MPPFAALITVATSSSARSSALIATGVRPTSDLSTMSANVFACARSLGVASASGSVNHLSDAWLAAATLQLGEHLVAFDTDFRRLLPRSQLTVLVATVN